MRCAADRPLQPPHDDAIAGLRLPDSPAQIIVARSPSPEALA